MKFYEGTAWMGMGTEAAVWQSKKSTNCCLCSIICVFGLGTKDKRKLFFQAVVILVNDEHKSQNNWERRQSSIAIPCGLAVCIKKGCVHLATNIHEIAANDKTEEGLLFKMFLIWRNCQSGSRLKLIQFQKAETVKSAILLSSLGFIVAAIHCWRTYISLPT